MLQPTLPGGTRSSVLSTAAPGPVLQEPESQSAVHSLRASTKKKVGEATSLCRDREGFLEEALLDLSPLGWTEPKWM